MTSASQGPHRSLPALLALAIAVLTAVVLAVAGLPSPAAHASAATQSAASHATTTSATARLGALASHRSKFNFSRIAFTGTRIVIAATDGNGDLDMFWQQVGSPKWHKEVVAKGRRGHRYAKPSITWTGHEVAIAAVNTSGDLFYFAQPQGASHWKHKLIGTSSGGTYEAASIAAAASGSIFVASARSSGELVSFELPSGSTTWAKQDVASGTFGAPSIIVFGIVAYISAPMGDALESYWRVIAGTPGSWNKDTVAFTVTGSWTAATLAADTNDVLLSAAVSTGAVYFFTLQTLGGSWSLQQVATGTGRSAYRNPQIAWTAATNGDTESFDVITATTRSGKLVFWWAVDGSTAPTWNPETIASPARRVSYATPGIGITAKSVVITDINSKPGNVDFWLQKFGATPWHHQVVARG